MGGEREETVGGNAKSGKGGKSSEEVVIQGGPGGRPEPGGAQAATSHPNWPFVNLFLSELANPKVGEFTRQKIRTHRANGEVHFHVDDEKLKVAVPAADAWSGWHRFYYMLQPFVWRDEKHGTILVIAPHWNNGVLDAVATVSPFAVVQGPTWQALGRVMDRG